MHYSCFPNMGISKHEHNQCNICHWLLPLVIVRSTMVFGYVTVMPQCKLSKYGHVYSHDISSEKIKRLFTLFSVFCSPEIIVMNYHQMFALSIPRGWEFLVPQDQLERLVRPNRTDVRFPMKVFPLMTL